MAVLLGAAPALGADGELFSLTASPDNLAGNTQVGRPLRLTAMINGAGRDARVNDAQTPDPPYKIELVPHGMLLGDMFILDSVQGCQYFAIQFSPGGEIIPKELDLNSVSVVAAPPPSVGAETLYVWKGDQSCTLDLELIPTVPCEKGGPDCPTLDAKFSGCKTLGELGPNGYICSTLIPEKNYPYRSTSVEPRSAYTPYGCSSAATEGSGAGASIVALLLLGLLLFWSVRRASAIRSDPTPGDPKPCASRSSRRLPIDNSAVRKTLGRVLPLVLLAALPGRPANARPAEQAKTAPAVSDPGPAPARLKLVLMDLQSIGPELKAQARLLTGTLQSELDAREVYQILSMAEVRTLLGLEVQKQLLGCGDADCMAELAGSLGSQRILSGTLARAGKSLLLTLQLVDADEAKSLVSRQLRVRDAESIEPLLDQVPGLVDMILERDPDARKIAMELRAGHAPQAPRLATGGDSKTTAASTKIASKAASRPKSAGALSTRLFVHGLVDLLSLAAPAPVLGAAFRWRRFGLTTAAILVPSRPMFAQGASPLILRATARYLFLGRNKLEPYADLGLVGFLGGPIDGKLQPSAALRLATGLDYSFGAFSLGAELGLEPMLSRYKAGLSDMPLSFSLGVGYAL